MDNYEKGLPDRVKRGKSRSEWLEIHLIEHAAESILAKKFGEDWSDIILRREDFSNPNKLKIYQTIKALLVQMEKCQSLAALEQFCKDNNLSWLSEEDIRDARTQASYDAGDQKYED